MIVMGVERYILTSSSYGVPIEIKENCKSGRSEV